MSCLYHSDRSAVNTCSKCGAWLCDGCSVEIDGRVVCKTCISRELEYNRGTDPRAAHTPHYGHIRPTARFNAFLVFCFSALPGANYMYMGLIKRGLCMMAAFFGSIYATATLGGLPFAFLIPILAVTSMFDGFRIRRLLNAGEKVEDNMEDVLDFLRSHRTLVIGVVVIAAMFAASNMLSNIFYFNFSLRRISPWVFIGLGCYFVFHRKGKARPAEAYAAHEDEQFIDKR